MKMFPLLLSFCIIGAVSALAQNTGRQAYAKPTLRASEIASTATRRDAREWTQRWHQGVHGGWFNGSNEEVAANYLTTVGPLGLRVYMHDKSWGTHPAFVERMPELLRDRQGEPYLNAIEVVDVLAGSPAEGHLKPGDLIFAIDGTSLLSASDLKLDQDYQHLHTRSLELHLGQLIDAAEGQGSTNLSVLRPRSNDRFPRPDGTWQSLFSQRYWGVGNAKQKAFEVTIPSGAELRLRVDDGGNGIGSDGFTWSQVVLVSDQSTIPLSDLQPNVFSVGYGSAATDPEKSSFTAHAESEIRFVAPDGGPWTLQGIPVPTSHATVNAHIEIRRPLEVPREILRAAKTIRIPIPKIGKFATSMPFDCPKSANIIAQQAAWLAAQQNEDGSWPRPQGYTSNHYDTAWAALGLMATGDHQFDANIKRASEFLSTKAVPDGWTVPSAMVGLFLAEYWLRYQDDSVLPSLEIWINQVLTETLTGDFVSGHGHNPGYAGGSVNTGGSNIAATLAVAAKTPVDVDTQLLDQMLIRAQQMAPDGHMPYGRSRGDTAFEPGLKYGATYSARHAPYLIASLVHGGPRLFTENCIAMYTDGPKGGSDQGHATETMTNQWAYPAMAAGNLDAYRNHLRAHSWYITLRRSYDGGFNRSAHRLEYAGGEGLLDFAIRTGSWLVALNAGKRNLAMTGHPKFAAKQLLDTPPIQHEDAVYHGQVLRDWAIVHAAATEAKLDPALLERLANALTYLDSLSDDAQLRSKLTAFLSVNALQLAEELASAADRANLQASLRGHLIEMLLGIDFRVDLATKADSSDGSAELNIHQQFPLAGSQLEQAKLATLGLEISGQLTLIDANNNTLANFPLDPSSGVNWNNWASKSTKAMVKAPAEGIPHQLQIQFQIDELQVTYQRPIFLNSTEDFGSGEKGRAIINDRQIKVPATLVRDHARWDFSFQLPTGRIIAAASQGNQVKVIQSNSATGEQIWISPQQRTLPAKTQGVFSYSSGWQRVEGRVFSVHIDRPNAIIPIEGLTQGQPFAKIGAAKDLIEGNTTQVDVNSEKPLLIQLGQAAAVRAIDLRGQHINQAILEAQTADGKWHTIHRGRPADVVKSPILITTKMLRLTLHSANNQQPKLTLLRLYP